MEGHKKWKSISDNFDIECEIILSPGCILPGLFVYFFYLLAALINGFYFPLMNPWNTSITFRSWILSILITEDGDPLVQVELPEIDCGRIFPEFYGKSLSILETYACSSSALVITCSVSTVVLVNLKGL